MIYSKPSVIARLSKRQRLVCELALQARVERKGIENNPDFRDFVSSVCDEAMEPVTKGVRGAETCHLDAGPFGPFGAKIVRCPTGLVSVTITEADPRGLWPDAILAVAHLVEGRVVAPVRNALHG